MKLEKRNLKLSKKDSYKIALSFIFCMILSSIIVYNIESNNYFKLKEKTRYAANSQVSRLQYVINTLLLKTQTLEMLVMEGKGKISNFEQIAEMLCDNTAIRSLQLAPDGIVTHVYPLKGNEGAFVNLFETKERAADAILARNSGELTLSGPFELYQGGFGIVARRPIYLINKDNEKYFWGFSIIILDLPEALYPAKLDNFKKEGFEYGLYQINPETNKKQIIDESFSKKMKNPIINSFKVPNGTWVLNVVPQEGWIHLDTILLEIFIVILFSSMVAIITSTFLYLTQQKEILSRITITDQLTGLLNYMKFMQQLEENMQKRIPYGVFFMDLNKFKKVNDTYGHIVGNQLLIETAKKLHSCFDLYGEIYRNGGDEFCAIIQNECNRKFYQELMEKVSRSFEEAFFIEEKYIYCSISIGYACYPEDSTSIEKLIQIADTRMYKMKNMIHCSGKLINE